MYKNIIRFYSCFCFNYPKCRYKTDCISPIRRWLKCTHTTAKVRFFCKASLAFKIVFCVKIFPTSNNFLDAYTNLVVTAPANALYVYTLPVYTLPVYTLPVKYATLKTWWQFRRGNTYILFTLGNRCTPCYATHTTFATFCWGNNRVLFTSGNRCTSCHATHASCQRGHLVDIQDNQFIFKCDPLQSQHRPEHTVCLLLKWFCKIGESVISTRKGFRTHFMLRRNDIVLDRIFNP